MLWGTLFVVDGGNISPQQTETDAQCIVSMLHIGREDENYFGQYLNINVKSLHICIFHETDSISEILVYLSFEHALSFFLSLKTQGPHTHREILEHITILYFSVMWIWKYIT